MRYLFSDCVIDTDRREIRRKGTLVLAGPKVFDILVYLICNRDRVITKDDLFASIWKGRIVSESTLTSNLNTVRAAIGDNGTDQRLIRTLPRKGIRFIGEVREEIHPAPPDRPSLAVLPFINMSGDPAREYFADGVTEEIIIELSGAHWLFVIARNSTFTYKGRPVDVKQAGRELGVRYVLEGSVREADNRLRISAQLIDATTGGHLWASRFDGEFEHVFDLQDRVASAVAAAIAPKLEQAEFERYPRKSTKDLSAYDCYLRGMAMFYRYAKEANTKALQYFERAFQLDPSFSAAYGMAAQCYGQRHWSGWMSKPAYEKAEAVRMARRAVDLGRHDAVALHSGGWILDFIGGDPQSGILHIDRACTLSPNLAAAWLAAGWVRIHLRDPEAAIGNFAKAMRLSPVDRRIFSMQVGMAFAQFYAGHDEEALSWAEQALAEKADWAPTLHIAIVSNALAGRRERAKELLTRLLALDPKFSLSRFYQFVKFAKDQDLNRFTEAFRSAGLQN